MSKIILAKVLPTPNNKNNFIIKQERSKFKMLTYRSLFIGQITENRLSLSPFLIWLSAVFKEDEIIVINMDRTCFF